jgi:hypothetical protein
MAAQLPDDAERRKKHSGTTRALRRARIERLLSRRDIPLRETTLWRMLHETATRASEILILIHSTRPRRSIGHALVAAATLSRYGRATQFGIRNSREGVRHPAPHLSHDQL